MEQWGERRKSKRRQKGPMCVNLCVCDVRYYCSSRWLKMSLNLTERIIPLPFVFLVPKCERHIRFHEYRAAQFWEKIIREGQKTACKYSVRKKTRLPSKWSKGSEIFAMQLTLSAVGEKNSFVTQEKHLGSKRQISPPRANSFNS